MKIWEENTNTVEKYLQKTFDICKEDGLEVNAGENVLAFCRHQKAGPV
jgi:hypothetical protein